MLVPLFYIEPHSLSPFHLSVKTIKKLTIIMPFLNEGAEPANTIQSIYDTCDPGMVDIIAIDDSSQFNFSDLSMFPSVKVIRNTSRKGVAACRQQGADLAETPLLFIIDGHMRFRNDKWLERLVTSLEREPQTIFCTTCVRLQPDQMNMNKALNKEYGANLLLVNPSQFGSLVARSIIEAQWAEPREPVEYEIQCVLGANYAVSASWFAKIRGFQGLQQWGSSEPFLSLKTWLSGGKCKILKDIEIGHMFRDTPPYQTDLYHTFYNKMWICKTIFPEDLANRLLSYLPKVQMYEVAEDHINADWRRVNEMREYCQSIFTRSIYDVCNQWGIWVPRGLAHDLFLSSGQPSSINPIQPPINLLQSSINPIQPPINPIQPPINLFQSSVDPVQSSVDPVQSFLKHIRSSINPVESSINPVESSIEPVQSFIDPVMQQTMNRTEVLNPVLKKTTNRTEVINCVAAAIGAESYLEIGVYDPRHNFDKIRCPTKVGVDPTVDAPQVERKTSDEFFDDLPSSTGFDLIFIDGDHRLGQVQRDIDNALNYLNEGGVVVLHDVNPTAAETALSERPSPQALWCGEVWKAFVTYRSFPDYSCATVDCDWGVGLILRRDNPEMLEFEGSGAGYGHAAEQLTYDWLANNRRKALKLIAPSEQAIRQFLGSGQAIRQSPGRFSAIYYTDNSLPETLQCYCFDQLSSLKAKGELIVVAQQPAEIFELADHLKIIGPQPRSHLSMYKQILRGLATAQYDRVFLVEHDVLYPEGYFNYGPPNRDFFWYNENTYRMNSEGFFRSEYLMTSNCCGDRELLHRALDQRIHAIQAGQRIIWAEPGIGGHDSYSANRWHNQYPTIDIRHGANFTGMRTSHAYLDSIPYWGNHAALKALLNL